MSDGGAEVQWLAVVAGGGGGHWPPWLMALFFAFWAVGAIVVINRKVKDRGKKDRGK